MLLIIGMSIVTNIVTIVLGYELMEYYVKRGNQYEAQR